MTRWQKLYVRLMTWWARLTFGYVSPAGLHRHKCPECSAVWEHQSLPWWERMCNQGLHTCPNGHEMAEPRWKYYGRRAPT